jgi:hypothetical protein
MALLKGLIKKLKCICPSIAPHTWKTGYIHSAPSNLHTIINNMLKGIIPHSNQFKVIVQSPSPIPFSHTKFPSLEEKMKQMINDREEALAAHELARTRIANRKQSNSIPFEKNQKVWLDMRNLKMNHHKKIAPK